MESGESGRLARMAVKTLRAAAVRRATSAARGGAPSPTVQALLEAWGVPPVVITGAPPSSGTVAPSLTLADALATPADAPLPIPLDDECVVSAAAPAGEAPLGVRGGAPPPPALALDEDGTSLHWALVDAAAVVELGVITSAAAAVSSACVGGGGGGGGAPGVSAASAVAAAADAVSALERLFPHASRLANGGDAAAGASSSPARLGALFSHASLLGLVGSAAVSASPWWGSASGGGGGLPPSGRGSARPGVLAPASPPLLVFGCAGGCRAWRAGGRRGGAA